MKNIDNEYTDEIVCPFCGNEFSDSFEYGKGEDIGLVECGECEKEFYATRNISVSYSTKKATYGTCKGCKSKKVVIEDLHSPIGKYSDLCLKCGEVKKYELAKDYINKLPKLITK